MRPIQRIIHAGFATAAIASASLPALSWTAWPNVDFERPAPPVSSNTFPTGSATARGPDTAIATPQPRAAADEVSRR